MIHLNVPARRRPDLQEWSGYAFGLGLDRMPMIRYGIDDIRLLFENDLASPPVLMRALCLLRLPSFLHENAKGERMELTTETQRT